MAVNASSYTNPRLDLGQAVWLAPESQDFIALSILPRFEVQVKAANFSAVTRASLLERGGNVKRASGAAYSRSDFGTTDLSYACVERGEEQKLPDDQRNLYAQDFDAEVVAARQAMHKVMLDLEIDVAAQIQNTTTWTSSDLTTNGDTWSTISSDIIGDVISAAEIVAGNTGLQPNTLIVSRATFANMLKNTALRANINPTQIPRLDMMPELIAGILGLERILVGRGVYNSNAEGLANSSTDIWSASYATVAHLPKEGSGLESPGLGRTFSWVLDAPDAGGVVVEEYREEQTRSTIYRARNYLAPVVFDAYFAHLIDIS